MWARTRLTSRWTTTASSWTPKAGVWRAASTPPRSASPPLLERDYRQKMPYKIVEHVLRTGIFRASGEPVDYSAEVEEALAPLRSATLNLMSEKWQRGTTVDVIYLSGGGAELVL